ncbi:MAG: pilus assembly PilX N-terminal domain-containing protein [Gemmatimonadetes bacterium]|nr:pilus assembly PilX N-terminal domain-containing protein [Gemmatimonadota bacterium]
MKRRSDSRRKILGHRGFALPAVIFALVIMSVLSVAALQTASDDRLSSRAVREGGLALYAAESGVNWVLNTVADSVAATLGPGDSADLGWQGLGSGSSYHAVLHRYDMDDGGQELFGLRVDGRGAVPLGGRRVVSVTLTRSTSMPLILNPLAPIAPVNGLRKTGTLGLFTGADGNACGTGTQPPIAGIAAPDNSILQDGVVVTGSEVWLDGAPSLSWTGMLFDALMALGIDWYGVLSLPPDYSLGRTAEWPDSATAFGGDQWPLIRLTRNITLEGPQSGQGLLVAEGDLTIGNDFNWNGLIFVGKNFTMNNDVTVTGGVVSGLNFIFGASIGAGNVGSGTVVMQYDSCYMGRASQTAIAKGLAPVSGGVGGLTALTTRAWGEVRR